MTSFSSSTDSGGTLHLPSPVQIRRVDPSLGSRQLRRSLSRSPSHVSPYRLMTVNSPSLSSRSSLSSTPVKEFTSPSLTSHVDDFINTISPSAHRAKPNSTNSGALPISSRLNLSRSPRKRALHPSHTQGNGVPRSCQGSSGQENDNFSDKPMSDLPESPTKSASPLYGGLFAPRATFKFEKGYNSWGAKSSPRKRNDGTVDFDRLGASPSAKRRSLHGGIFGPDFDIFKHSSQEYTEPTLSSNNCEGLSGSSLQKRTSSLRRSTIQQRLDKPVHPRVRQNHEPSNSSDDSASSGSKSRFRMSLDSALLPPVARDSPFSSQGTLLNASIHPIALRTTNSTETAHSSRHPLSRTISQSTSSSGMTDDSPSHLPIQRPNRPHRTFIDFSKSLPASGRRPTSQDGESQESKATFATPNNYKLVKPLPAAFMSTGLISKRHKDLDESSTFGASTSTMPDTPCKRHSLNETVSPIVSVSDSVQPLRFSRMPATPFNPQTSLSPSKSFSLTRESTYDNDDCQSPSPKNSHSSTPSDHPPTPTKVGSSIRLEAATSKPTFLQSGRQFAHTPDDIYPYRLSPRTPRDSMIPPDPSGLSISISRRDEAVGRQSVSSLSALAPATPTTTKDPWNSHAWHMTPSHPTLAPETDSILTSRFVKVKIIGTGEFSQVFRVQRKSALSRVPSYFSIPTAHDTSADRLPDQVWAVKKSRFPYLGSKDRFLKMQEVDTLRSLGTSDHTIEFIDSWEHNNHLYIQTEFCEEGSLDQFLSRVGQHARLDAFRIWKILLELCLGTKHIHDAGYIHLDLKPANVLITFEGALKIADFGMATKWPARAGIEGEGDREYIGPEILRGQYDKPADIFAMGLIMLEIAGNVVLPDNGVSWQRLRSGDMSDVPSLTWSSENSNLMRDISGKPLNQQESLDDFYCSVGNEDDDQIGGRTTANTDSCTPDKRTINPTISHRSGELSEPPAFLVDQSHPAALDHLVRWMISPSSESRPVCSQILAAVGVQWTESRRRASATVFEGNWGPADEVLADDAEMIDV